MTIRLAACVALACVLGVGHGLAADPTERNEASVLSLTSAMSPADMAAETARGTDASVGTSADVSDVPQQHELHAEANASGSVDGPLVIGPLSTGGFGMLSSAGGQGLTPTIMQISTGVGNIQQGVSAVALSQ